MVIIMIAMISGSLIYVNIVNSNNAWLTVRGELLLQEISLKIKMPATIMDSESKYKDEKFEIHPLFIQKSIHPYNNSENIRELRIKAFNDKGKIVADHRELIIVP